MEMKQIAPMLNNQILPEVLGESVTVNEDLSNISDTGTAIFNANAVEPFSNALVNQIGRMVFVDRVYEGGVPSVLMDSWLWGSVMAKVSVDLPDVELNESWELSNGASYDPNIFYGSNVLEKFFNKRVTAEIPKSFTELQLRQSFQSAEQFNGFISMLYTSVDNALTICIDELVMRTINGGMAEAINASHRIDLLAKYNTVKGTSLTPAAAIITEDFLKFCSYQIALYAKRMSRMSVNFNVGGKARFTPASRRKVVLLSDFAEAIGPYTLAGAFNKEDIRFPDFDSVPFWQGNDQGSYDLDEVSAIDVKLPSDGSTTVSQAYIIGCIFDRDALGVSNLNKRVTSNYNPKAEFFSNWYKFELGSFIDTNEQMLVFTIAGS